MIIERNFSQEFIFLPKDTFSPWGWARTETVTQLYFTLFGLDSAVRTGWGLADNRQAFIGMDRLTGGFVVLQEEPPGKHKLLIFNIVLFVWTELLVCTGCFLLLKVLSHILQKGRSSRGGLCSLLWLCCENTELSARSMADLYGNGQYHSLLWHCKWSSDSSTTDSDIEMSLS